MVAGMRTPLQIALCLALVSCQHSASTGGVGSAGSNADVVRTVNWEGLRRPYRLHRPPGPAGAPRPLVLNLHGLGSDAQQQEALSGIAALADREGFLVAEPEGTGREQSWNAGLCCGQALRRGVDDVGYIGAVLDDVASQESVDPARIFVTGFSNGGFLAHRLACEMSDRIAAIAPVAGVLGVDCAPKRPVSVLQFHGTADPLVPYGGGGPGFPPVSDVMAGWAHRDGCGSTRETTFQAGDVTCEKFQGCPAGVGVELCRVDRGGHTWPSAASEGEIGRTTTGISATERMWQFFQAHPR
jgi:polyhydroxybutyrate depolymerase